MYFRYFYIKTSLHVVLIKVTTPIYTTELSSARPICAVYNWCPIQMYEKFTCGSSVLINLYMEETQTQVTYIYQLQYRGLHLNIQAQLSNYVSIESSSSRLEQMTGSNYWKHYTYNVCPPFRSTYRYKHVLIVLQRYSSGNQQVCTEYNTYFCNYNILLCILCVLDVTSSYSERRAQYQRSLISVLTEEQS